MIKRNDEGQRDAKRIEEKTRGQSSKHLWDDEREWRLTASRFGAICKATERRNMLLLAKSILHPRKLSGEAVTHGLMQEENAAKKFSELTGLKVKPCGLFIDQELSYLAASPDGLVGQDGEALLEIKSPYTQRDNKISDAHLFPFLELKNGELRLKRNHDFFFQIQGQLHICRKKVCYFVVYTFIDIHIEKIEADCLFFAEKMLPYLSNFWETHYLPCIVQSLVCKEESNA